MKTIRFLGLIVVVNGCVSLCAMNSARQNTMRVQPAEEVDGKEVKKVSPPSSEPVTQREVKRALSVPADEKKIVRTAWLYQAIYSCRQQMVRKLLRQGVYPNGTKDMQWWTYDFSRYGFEAMIAEKALVHATTPLNFAVKEALRCYRALSSNAKLKNRYEKYCQIVRMIATTKGVLFNCPMALDLGDNKTVETFPHYHALIARDWDLAFILFDAGAPRNIRDRSGYNAAIYAGVSHDDLAKAYAKYVQVVLKQDPKKRPMPKDRYTPGRLRF